MELRLYQKQAINKMIAFYEKSNGKEASQIIMATGTGKTEVFLAFLSELKKRGIQTRCLILERQIDLVKQTSERAKKYFPMLNIEQWYDGEIVTPKTKDYIVVSTAQTLSKYLLPTILNKEFFNIIIVDDETIHELNKTYRGKDSVTDVISFALEDDDSFIKTDYRVLGDIYICLNKAKSQAVEYGHSFLRELAFLTVHGLLHLLGYDHMVKEEEEVMFKLQEVILNEYGIKKDN
jgi:probable rRNA maturation factor